MSLEEKTSKNLLVGKKLKKIRLHESSHLQGISQAAHTVENSTFKNTNDRVRFFSNEQDENNLNL